MGFKLRMNMFATKTFLEFIEICRIVTGKFSEGVFTKNRPESFRDVRENSEYTKYLLKQD